MYLTESPESSPGSVLDPGKTAIELLNSKSMSNLSQILPSLVVKSTRSKIHDVDAGPLLEAAAVGPWVGHDGADGEAMGSLCP